MLGYMENLAKTWQSAMETDLVNKSRCPWIMWFKCSLTLSLHCGDKNSNRQTYQNDEETVMLLKDRNVIFPSCFSLFEVWLTLFLHQITWKISTASCLSWWTNVYLQNSDGWKRALIPIFFYNDHIFATLGCKPSFWASSLLQPGAQGHDNKWWCHLFLK